MHTLMQFRFNDMLHEYTCNPFRGCCHSHILKNAVCQLLIYGLINLLNLFAAKPVFFCQLRAFIIDYVSQFIQICCFRLFLGTIFIVVQWSNQLHHKYLPEHRPWQMKGPHLMAAQPLCVFWFLPQQVSQADCEQMCSGSLMHTYP